MNRDEIFAMSPGRELDALVAEKVMGWKDVGLSTVEICMVDKGTDEDVFEFEPSSNISASWEVVEKIQDSGLIWSMRMYNVAHEVDITMGQFTVVETNVPLGICKAALLALCVEDASDTNESAQGA